MSSMDKVPADGPEGRRGIGRSIRSLFPDIAPEGAPDDDVPGPTEGTPGAGFVESVRLFLSAPPGERQEEAEVVRAAARELQKTHQSQELARGVLLLLLGGGAEDLHEEADPGALAEDAVALARDLTQPHVATQVAVRLGTERDPEARGQLIDAVSRLPDLMAPALSQAAGEAPDRGARRACMEALRALGDEGRREAERMLEDPRWFVVRNGVTLLADFGGKDAVPQLTGALGHEDPRVRREAVMSVARLGGEDAGMLLLGMLEDQDLDVRAAAVMGVAALKVEKAVRPLLRMLDEVEDEDLQVEVLRALGRLGDPGAVPAVEKRARGSLFTRPARPVRIAAFRALAAIGTPHAREVLKEGAEEKDPEVRQVARSLLPKG